VTNKSRGSMTGIDALQSHMRGVCGRKEVEGIARVPHRAVADILMVAMYQQVIGTQHCKQTIKLKINSKRIALSLTIFTENRE
jgi:hypothetical protein